jgi:phosphoserine phosphatase RsbU/P
MSKRMRILVGGGLLTLMTAGFLVHLAGFVLPPLGSDNGFEASWEGVGEPHINRVDPNGPAAGRLQPRDEIVAVNGVKFQENPAVVTAAVPISPGTRTMFTIRREGRLIDVEITSIPSREKVEFDTDLLIVLLYLLIAWIVFLLKPEDKLAWLLALMLAAITGLIGFDTRNIPRWLAAIPSVGGLLGTLFFPILFHFFLIFPQKSRLLYRWPWLDRYLYLPYLLITLPVALAGKSFGFMNALLVHIGWVFSKLVIPANIVATGYLLAAIISLLINYKDVDTMARRKLRLAVAGSAAGILNLLLLNIGWLSGLDRWFGAFWSWLNPATSITLPIIPLVFAYAIIRHKVIPVSLIIRRGVRYLLVSRGSILLEILAVIGVVTLLLTIVFRRFQPPGIVIGLVSALTGVAAWRLSKWLHDRYLAPVIDRKFFRQSYDSQQIMTDLATSLRSTTSIPQLVEQLAVRIQTALQTENVAVLLKNEKTGDFEGSAYRPYSNNGYKSQAAALETSARLPGFSEAAAQIEASGQPLEIDLEDGRSDGVGQVEETALRAMNSALLSPLVGKDGMAGVISVGPRLGDVPFSSEDKRLLMSLAGPTTFALENARLLERMVEDARKRQEIEAENEARAKELEEARQLQLSMLPRKLPTLPELEIAAYMKPATEVGGDYYDFHLNSDGALTIAIGDATGHGLKAGSVVIAMKSMFYLLAGEASLVSALDRSSRALKQMNLRSLYMALTLIRIQGYQMRIASAGMPPILIYRANDGAVDEILFRALPLGSLSNYAYQEREAELYPGDIVVLMSDGLPERFNPQSEMFDYPRVSTTMKEARKDSSQGVIEHFVQAGDQWGDGRPQDDDITFVVLRVK